MKSQKKTIFDREIIYLGERLDLLGGIQHAFRASGGRIMKFSDNLGRGLYFGDSYLVSAAGTIAVPPKKCERPRLKITEQERLDFELQKELVKVERLKRRKALEIKKPHADIVAALELLRPFVRGADNFTLRRFVGYLEHQLSKPAKRRK
jgi:hypothetical protein